MSKKCATFPLVKRSLFQLSLPDILNYKGKYYPEKSAYRHSMQVYMPVMFPEYGIVLVSSKERHLKKSLAI